MSLIISLSWKHTVTKATFLNSSSACVWSDFTLATYIISISFMCNLFTKRNIYNNVSEISCGGLGHLDSSLCPLLQWHCFFSWLNFSNSWGKSSYQNKIVVPWGFFNYIVLVLIFQFCYLYASLIWSLNCFYP